MEEWEVMQWTKTINNIQYYEKQLGNFIITELFIFITKNQGRRTKHTLNKTNTCNNHSTHLLPNPAQNEL